MAASNEALDQLIASWREEIAALPGALAPESYPAPNLADMPMPADAISALKDAELAPFIDHTLLKADVEAMEIAKLCAQAKEFGCGAVCVNPCRVEQCVELLAGSGVAVASVVGFPLGATTYVAKSAEAADLVRLGAQELDMVINIGYLKDAWDAMILRDMRMVVEVAAPARVKVILETSLLTDAEKIRGCLLAQAAGAHFVKTGTGLHGPATVEDVRLMRYVVGPSMGVKASGGVKDALTARAMLAAGASRIGASATGAILGRA